MKRFYILLLLFLIINVAQSVIASEISKELSKG